MVRRLLILLLLVSCAACSGPRGSVVDPPLRLVEAAISEDTRWQGRVIIDKSVKVYKGATLTISPGTEVSFVRRDEDRDGLGDAALIVEGALHAEGTREAPIRFRSASPDPRPGDWLEIRVDFSPDVRLRWCEITDSAYTLHAHFTRGFMEDCTVRGNIDGCRLGQSSFAIRNCLVEENEGKGINFRNSSVEIARNIIRANGSGIFLFESDREFSIHHNNIVDNGDNFRLGDFYTGNVELHDNWWGTADPRAAAETVHDRKRDEAIGRVTLHPADAWRPGTGPRDSVALMESWTFQTGGFVDAAPVSGGGQIFVPGWDGRLYALDAAGRLLWSRELGDVADADPVLDAGAVYVQTWQREVFAFDRRSGDELWRFTYSPSLADDHRQGGLLRIADLLLVPAWNGTLFALEAATGLKRWQIEIGQPLRSAPVTDGERIYVTSGSGILAAVTREGNLLWRRDGGAPLLAAPAPTPWGVVALSREGRLFAFDKNGTMRWESDLGEACFYASPFYLGGYLFIATAEGALLKVDARSGRLLWRRQFEGPFYGTPRAAAGRIVVGDNSGRLQVLNAQSGDLLASFSTDGAIQGMPALLSGQLIFGSRDHRIYALRFTSVLPEVGEGVTDIRPEAID